MVLMVLVSARLGGVKPNGFDEILARPPSAPHRRGGTKRNTTTAYRSHTHSPSIQLDDRSLTTIDDVSQATSLIHTHNHTHIHTVTGYIHKMILWWVCTAVAGAAVAAKMNQQKIDAFFMGVFRDIGRHKAYKRRNASYALMSVLLHQEESLLLEDDSTDDLDVFTLDELWEFGNGEDDKPLLLSIFGFVYDVTAGEKFYGPHSSYGMFSGRDVTYALSTGCKKCATDTGKTIDDLNEKQLKEGKRWLSFFQLHDKYPCVGKLEGNNLDLLMDDLIQKDMAKGMTEEDMMKNSMAPPIRTDSEGNEAEGEAEGTEEVPALN